MAWKIATSAGITQDAWPDWAHYFAASTLWPIAKENKIIGFLMLHGMPDDTIMMHTIVAPEWEGRWVNKTILRAFRGWDCGCDVVTLVGEGKEKAAKVVGFEDSGKIVGSHKIFIKRSEIKETRCQQ